jgi:hypothetical protein
MKKFGFPSRSTARFAARFVARFAAIFALFVLAHTGLHAKDLPIHAIPDDANLRKTLSAKWFLSPKDGVLALPKEQFTLPSGEKIEVRTEKTADQFTVALAREASASFPGWIQGSFSYTRSLRDGSPGSVRFFLRSDPYTYIQFRPDPVFPERSLLDAVVYNAYLRRSLSVPLSLNDILTLPLRTALEAVGELFPAEYFEPRPENYGQMREFIRNVRKAIRGFNFHDDGAIDENGAYVYIETGAPQDDAAPGLNCSGFAKYLIDGILRPVKGERLKVEPLKAAYIDKTPGVKERGSAMTRPFEESRDPFFGLDWTRNLAAEVFSVQHPEVEGRLTDFEVSTAPFTEIILRKKEGSSIWSYPDHLSGAGFASEGIEPLLYTLAINEPGNMYLAAINTERAPKPRMREYFHIAALLPWFDAAGIFHVTVFESAEETQFSAFKNRYPGHLVNLVRIPIEGYFEP